LDTGQTLVLESRERAHVGETIPLKNIMVDGLGVGDVGTVVLRDRQTMAKDGVVIIIIPLEQETGNLAGEIEVVSRGFVYMRESKPLIDGSIEVVKRTLMRVPKKNWSGVKESVANALEDYFYSETKRLPMILPVIIEV
jgi:ribonuclease J